MNRVKVSLKAQCNHDEVRLHPSDTDEALSVYQSMLQQLLMLQGDLRKRTHYLRTAEQAIEESISNLNRKLALLKEGKNSRERSVSRIKDMLLTKE